MIKKLKQIWRDHQAMNMVRDYGLDVHLNVVSYTLGERGFECTVWGKTARVNTNEPERAILAAFEA